MNPSHTWFCHNSIQSPFNSSTYLDYSSKKNAGMWWQRARIIFLFPPLEFWWLCTGKVETWRSVSCSAAQTTLMWRGALTLLAPRLHSLRSWTHDITHTTIHTHMWVCTTSRTQAAERSQWGWQRSGVEWQTEKMIVIILCSFFFLINNE